MVQTNKLLVINKQKTLTFKTQVFKDGFILFYFFYYRYIEKGERVKLHTSDITKDSREGGVEFKL